MCLFLDTLTEGFFAFYQFNDDQTFYKYKAYQSFNPPEITFSYSSKDSITYEKPSVVPSLTGPFAMRLKNPSYLTFNHPSKTWTSITVMVWFNPMEENAFWNRPILSVHRSSTWSSGIVLEPGSGGDNRPRVKNFGGAGNANCDTARVQPNTWYHLAYSYDYPKRQMKLFVNGTKDFTGTSRTNNYGNLDTVRIGRWNVYYANGFSIAQAEIYDTALNGAGVLQRFQESLTVSTPKCNLS